MTHDDILQAARDRIAEIDKQAAALTIERLKLQALLGQPKAAPVALTPFPWIPDGIVYPLVGGPWQPARPYITWTVGEPRPLDTHGVGLS